MTLNCAGGSTKPETAQRVGTLENSPGTSDYQAKLMKELRKAQGDIGRLRPECSQQDANAVGWRWGK